MESLVTKCSIAENASSMKDKLSEADALIEDLKLQLVAANMSSIRVKSEMKDQSGFAIQLHKAIGQPIKDIERFVNDLLHYVELENLDPEESLKVYSALKFARRMRRALLDKRVLINSAFFELTGKSLGHSEGKPYEYHSSRLSGNRTYAPRYMSLPDVLEGKYFNKRLNYAINTD